MKVVLVKNVENLGIIGDIKEVKDGYARNWLLKQGLAVKTGDIAAKEIINKIKAERAKLDKQIESFKLLAQQIEGLTYKISAKAGEKNKLFGAVTSEDIAKIISTKDAKLDSKQIEVPLIKSLGEYDIVVNFGGDVKANVKLIVEAKNK